VIAAPLVRNQFAMGLHHDRVEVLDAVDLGGKEMKYI
jgi:hypothetical protein